MTLLHRTLTPAPPVSRAELRRRVRHDVLGARLAELDRIGSVVDEAREIIEQGWVQHGWFAYVDETGRSRLATAHDLHLIAGRPVVGACLVGALVLGGGGIPAAGGQLVSRTMDLTWHTLRGEPGTAVRWCPSPPERAVQVRNLTSWNDARGRTADQVRALLEGVRSAADSETDRTRQEYAAG